MRAALLLGLLLVSLGLGGRIEHSIPEDDARPNVLFLMSDQHRWHSMGHTEMPELETPAMDRLATQGTRLTRALSNYPLCAPMRAMLLTGRWPYSTGVIDNPHALKSSELTLGRVFRGAGYDTGYIGKWHLGQEPGSAYGFDHSILWSNTGDHWSSVYEAEGQRPSAYSDYNAVGMADQAIEFLRTKRERPFFLIVSFDPPHPSLDDPPREVRGKYPKGVLSYRGNLDAAWKEGREFRLYQGYHAHITALDHELGRVLDTLDELELAGRTLVVYTSDHGTMLGSHGYTNLKRLPYDESVRVPFLARWPGHIPSGVRRDALFSVIDVFPTLCGLAGVPTPELAAGADRSQLFLGGETRPGSDSVFLMHIELEERREGAPQPVPLYRGIRTDRHTYAVTEEGPWLLFDDRDDPLQLENLAADPQHAELRARLAKELGSWIERAEDPFVLPASVD